MQNENEKLETRTGVVGLVDNLVMPELWMIWDTRDGDETIIEAKDYVEFCKTTERDFWGFDVTRVEIGKPRSQCEDIETYELHIQAEKEMKT